MTSRYGLILAFLVAAVFASPRSGSAGTCGDLNGDGRLTIADAVRLLKATLVPNPADCGGLGSAQCCNVFVPDGDVCGIGDVVVLLNVLVGNPTLVPPCFEGPEPLCAPSPGSGPGGDSWTSRGTLSGNVVRSVTVQSGCRVDVDGMTFVHPGATVTFEPGVLVVGKNPPTPNGGATNLSALVFLRGSKIDAAGTVAHPIIMTSEDHVDRNDGRIGNWGGLTLNGAAPVNCPGGECLAEGLVGVPFGGTDPTDSSGVLEYVRVEFTGKEVAPDDVLPGLTLNGVGRGTIYDHVQVNVSFDTCQTWFGGTVNGKYLVSSACGNDLFDTQVATRGDVQYGLGVFYQPLMQNAGNEGIEWDDNENGFDLLPRNAPTYCNMTLIGTALQPSVGLGASERAILLRRGTAGTIANFIAEHFRIDGLELGDNPTAAQACDSPTQLHVSTPSLPDQLIVEHGIFFDNSFAGDGAIAGHDVQVDEAVPPRSSDADAGGAAPTFSRC